MHDMGNTEGYQTILGIDNIILVFVPLPCRVLRQMVDNLDCNSDMTSFVFYRKKE